MSKTRNEIRDPVHGLIEFDDLEKTLIDTPSFQRLRDIHQLALCYQVYPGTTHKRFEHSLGVMHLAGLIFDTIFDEDHRTTEVAERLEGNLSGDKKGYWRRVVRAGALLHDLGHLPFSHAAEDELLPKGWNHERITADIIIESEIADLLKASVGPIRPEHVVTVAWDPGKRAKYDPSTQLSPWDTLLSKIVTDNAFGADRMDYLLRDSLHAGVAYGRFDADHLIRALRILINPENDDLAIGLDIGGIHSAEALALARYYMYTQVYFHDVRRVYDLHLKDFLTVWLDGGKFPVAWQDIVKITDNEVLVALRSAAADSNDEKLHILASRVMTRQHFRTVYELLATDKQLSPTIFTDLVEFAKARFGENHILTDILEPKPEANSFPVMTERGTIENSLRISKLLRNIPDLELGLIFATPDLKNDALEEIAAKAKTLLEEAKRNELPETSLHSEHDQGA